MQIFSKKLFISLSLLFSLFFTSSCGNIDKDKSFSFYKTFINPNYSEVEIGDYLENIEFDDEKLDLESVPESEIE